ncbi:hypothetical protein JL09_g5970 [Pichia kudriavzevii]|uniref:Uncharacterized protein n=1 Tax=Pichia kudriavzevii TaxID=4909 RepID=A0A099NSN4_PICKU|nr:hypothetical protein JL09_g5970 [Pichia kudriavzevii]
MRNRTENEEVLRKGVTNSESFAFRGCLFKGDVVPSKELNTVNGFTSGKFNSIYFYFL